MIHTLHPTTCTIHHTPYILHPILITRHPTPYTLPAVFAKLPTIHIRLVYRIGIWSLDYRLIFLSEPQPSSLTTTDPPPPLDCPLTRAKCSHSQTNQTPAPESSRSLLTSKAHVP